MASSPKFKVYDARGVYQASTKEPEQAAVLISFLGQGSTIRFNHGKVLWTEGDDGAAAHSYDAVATVCHDRM